VQDGGVTAGHIADQTNPHGVTKDQVGLSEVDNTADVDKPLSQAQSDAISAEATARGAAIGAETTARTDALDLITPAFLSVTAASTATERNANTWLVAPVYRVVSG
jgi:hypothetical protein